MVGVTWATSEVYRRIHNWKMAEGIETLSDHLYILMETTSTATQASSTRGVNRSRPPLRWRSEERDKEMLQAVDTLSSWTWDARTTSESIDEEA